MRREGQREGEKHQCVVASCTPHTLRTWPVTQACALTGNQTGDPLVHRTVLNSLNHTNQGGLCTSYTNPVCFSLLAAFNLETNPKISMITV